MENKREQIVFDVEKEIAILVADIRGEEEIYLPPWIVERLEYMEMKLEKFRKGEEE